MTTQSGTDMPTGGPTSGKLPKTRAELLALHAAARARRAAAALGSDEFRAAAEEVARIEVALNGLEEPPAPA